MCGDVYPVVEFRFVEPPEAGQKKSAIVERFGRAGMKFEQRVVARQRLVRPPEIFELEGLGENTLTIDRDGYFVKAAVPTTCLTVV